MARSGFHAADRQRQLSDLFRQRRLSTGPVPVGSSSGGQKTDAETIPLRRACPGGGAIEGS
jgi:hypothetical protein